MATLEDLLAGIKAAFVSMVSTANPKLEEAAVEKVKDLEALGSLASDPATLTTVLLSTLQGWMYQAADWIKTEVPKWIPSVSKYSILPSDVLNKSGLIGTLKAVLAKPWYERGWACAQLSGDAKASDLILNGLSGALKTIGEAASLGQLESIGEFVDATYERSGIHRFSGILEDILLSSVFAPELRRWVNWEFRPSKLSPSDCMRYYTKALGQPTTELIPSGLGTELAYYGYGSTDSQRLWDSHWEIPNVSLIIQMYRRGLLNRLELVSLIEQNDYHPHFSEKIVQMSERFPTSIELRMMARIVDFTDAEIDAIVASEGLLPEYRERYRTFLRSQRVDDSLSRMATTAITFYKEGYHDKEWLRARLTECKFSTFEIEAVFKEADLKDSYDNAMDVRSRVVKDVKSGALTLIQAYERLRDSGMRQDRAKTYLANALATISLEDLDTALIASLTSNEGGEL